MSLKILKLKIKNFITRLYLFKKKFLKKNLYISRMNDEYFEHKKSK